MKKTLSRIFAALFLIACLIPGVGLVLTGGSEAAANEILPAAPELFTDGALNDDFLADTADYVNGRFSLRLECITAWAKLNAALFRTSTAENVLLGSDGWLYYSPTRDDYTGASPMSEREIYCAARTLCLLQEYAESRGGSFLFTIAPNKNTLYGEHMPALTRLGGTTNADALYDALDTMGVSYLDLREAFTAQQETLYFRTDSHWNARGAALAADALLASLGRGSDYFAETVSEGTPHRGDLYEMLYPAGRETEEDFAYTPGFTFTANTENADRVTITTESAAGEGTLLCYRDSFGRNLYPYLAESFASAEFSRKNDYTAASLPDGGTLMIELVERNLQYLIEYDSAAPAPERDISLASDAAESTGTARITSAETKDGRTLFAVEWDGAMPDDDSNVYVLCGDTLFEAVPRPDGAIVSLAEGTEIHAVYASVGGNLVCLSAVYAIE